MNDLSSWVDCDYFSIVFVLAIEGLNEDTSEKSFKVLGIKGADYQETETLTPVLPR